MYTLLPTKAFLRKIKKVLATQKLKQDFKVSLLLLEKDPFSKGLATHKVQSRIHGLMYSSRVSKDIHIIWNFDENDRIIILLFDIGGHEGKGRVYR